MVSEQNDCGPDQHDDLAPLINSIYHGLLEHPLWQSFLERLGDTLEASSVTLLLRAPEESDRGVLLSSGTDRDWEDADRDRYFTHDPFGPLDRGEVRVLDEVLSSDEMLVHPFYVELLEPGGSFHVLALDIREPTGLLAKRKATRTQSQGRFGDLGKSLCMRMSSHLELALQLHSRITGALTERDRYARAVDQLSIGAVVLDERARIIHMNQIAAQILEQGDGLIASDGELIAPTAKEKAQLAESSAKSRRLTGRAR